MADRQAAWRHVRLPAGQTLVNGGAREVRLSVGVSVSRAIARAVTVPSLLHTCVYRSRTLRRAVTCGLAG